MIKAEWTSNDALSTEQVTQTNAPNTLNTLDCISRQAAIDACHNYEEGKDAYAFGDIIEERLQALPSAHPEPLTDKEQRIFLAAMGREEKVCKEVDEEWEEAYGESLVGVCREIERKVKKALWTN